MKKPDRHPEWTLVQKRPGTELRCIRGKYYLYECRSFYDKEKKKTRKKTGVYPSMMAFSTLQMHPEYYRLLPGNVKDVTAFISSIEEFGDHSRNAK